MSILATKINEQQVTPCTVKFSYIWVITQSLLFVFILQPPPQIYDKQLDEREHTIEEWKGDSTT